MDDLSKEHPHGLSPWARGKKRTNMKSKTAIIAAILLGFLAYSLPLYAGGNSYHIEEKTVIQIPVVGKITTLTSSYFSGCKLKERTSFKMHNTLIKALSDGKARSESVHLSDMCEEKQWQYDKDADSYKEYTFTELREKHNPTEDDDDVQIDMEIDQNDINELPKITRDFQGTKKNINGHKAQKVVTWVHLEETENPLIIEEYYSKDSKALSKINDARDDLRKETRGISDVAGVPSFIKFIYNELQEDNEWAKPDGEVVRLSIRLLDEDDDTVFSMDYDVTLSEMINYQEDHYSLR
jgi:archaellum component FlaC